MLDRRAVLGHDLRRDVAPPDDRQDGHRQPAPTVARGCRPRGHRCRRRGSRQPCREVAVAGPSPFEGKPQPPGRPPGGGHQRGIVGLGQVDEAVVVAEVDREKLRVPVQAEAGDHQPVEVAGQEVGQEERRRVVVGDRGEVGGARRRTRSSARRAAVPRPRPRGRGRAGRRSRSRHRRRRSARSAVEPPGSWRARRPGCRPAGCAGWPAGRSGRRWRDRPGRSPRRARGRARRSR